MDSKPEPLALTMQTQPPDSLATRFSLLLRLKNWADRDSWQEFFDTYWRLLYNVARKAGLPDADAQEVVQDTIIAAAKNIGGFKADPKHGSFKAWLLQQARWQIAGCCRQRAKAGAPANPDRATPGAIGRQDDTNRTDTLGRIADPEGIELERVWDQEWSENRMAVALERVKQQVSVKQYQIFDLSVLQGASCSETARTIGVSMASVYMAKYRVGSLLKTEMRKLEAALL
ncbi:MAG TPA: sigma-70 family RNA polymerase sigma factor [Verrucomicrobiae bacterium]